MARLKLEFPEDQFCYSTHLTVRVTDINAANHLSNDSMISMISEACPSGGSPSQQVDSRSITSTTSVGLAMHQAPTLPRLN